MSENSKIEWTHHTFNPWHGCAKVSPGCDNCYAERDSKRFNGDKVIWGVHADRLELSESYWQQPLKWDRRAAQAGERHRVFCASMADVFDKNAPTGARERLWELIEQTPNLDWLLLTKRIGNVPDMIPARWVPALPRNIWLGISVVNQEEADRDIPKLLATPALVHFLSMEPLLGPVDLKGWLDVEQQCPCGEISCDHEALDWVIVGGESGPNARPMHPDWAYDLRDQCVAAGVPFLFKQWGEWANPGCGAFGTAGGKVAHIRSDGSFWDQAPQDENADALTVVRAGKKAAGRDLGGRTYDEFPVADGTTPTKAPCNITVAN